VVCIVGFVSIRGRLLTLLTNRSLALSARCYTHLGNHRVSVLKDVGSLIQANQLCVGRIVLEPIK
jgi:hypothetical protein